MTLIFIRSFSSLLKKFYPNKEKISRLIEIPQYFDINEQIFIQQEEVNLLLYISLLIFWHNFIFCFVF